MVTKSFSIENKSDIIEPREGVIQAKYEADVTKVNEYIKEVRYSAIFICFVKIALERNWELRSPCYTLF